MIWLALTALGSLALAGTATVCAQQDAIDEACAGTRGYF